MNILSAFALVISLISSAVLFFDFFGLIQNFEAMYLDMGIMLPTATLFLLDYQAAFGALSVVLFLALLLKEFSGKLTTKDKYFINTTALFFCSILTWVACQILFTPFFVIMKNL